MSTATATGGRATRRSAPTRLVGWVRSWPPIVQDGVLALVVLAIHVAILAEFDVDGIADEFGLRHLDLLGYVLFAGQTLPILTRRRFPLASFLATAASVVLLALLEYAAPANNYGVLLTLYSVVVYRTLRLGVVGAIVALAASQVVYEVVPQVIGLAQRLADVLIFATALALGDGTRNRMELAAEQQARLEALAREQDRMAEAAVRDERARIAREMHDLVAHSMSVVAVQAGVGHHLIDQRPEHAKAALATIEHSSREALTEMRRMLGVLRSDGGDDALELAPQPGLAGLDALCQQVRDAGLTVEIERQGAERPLPSGVDLSAFRIAQEALTNVLRHAGPARVHIVLDYRPDHLELRVEDDGRGLSSLDPDHRGFGIIGMRERAAVVGGELHTGPRPGGGFRVAAVLPYGEAA
ncbi:MAG TPA: sensor histidine kinase [Acidimicrobiales bacterium]|nr:sensor histidine kinase [Acidimicrobiales bacterium]